MLKLSSGPSSPLSYPTYPYPMHGVVSSHLSGLAPSSPFEGALSPVLHSPRFSPHSAPTIGLQQQHAPVPLDAMNTETEHWLVVGKEEAEQLDNPSASATQAAADQPSHDSNMVVTFPPGSYIVVPGVEVGRNAWFKAQKCTCNTYRHGFLRVRRPATIRVSATPGYPTLTKTRDQS